MNAVIYARYSSDNQREESIEGQLRECKEYADQNGITVVRTYIDRALSAKTDSRPQFQQMIHDSATHTFEAVLVWKLDRFSRNRYDSAHYKRILKNNRVHVVSVTEPISNTPEGIMLESLLEGMAEYYSAELAEKVSRGHKENALKAKFNGGSGAAGLSHRQRASLSDRPNHRTGGAGSVPAVRGRGEHSQHHRIAERPGHPQQPG